MIIWDDPVAFLLFFGAVAVSLLSGMRLLVMAVDAFRNWRERRAAKKRFDAKMSELNRSYRELQSSIQDAMYNELKHVEYLKQIPTRETE